MKTTEPIEMIETPSAASHRAPHGLRQGPGHDPPNAPEQRNAGFATGEADTANYPEDLEIGRFSTGQDQSESIVRGCFAEGQETEPKAIDPDEGFAERQR
jgi:hypothetical protein